MIGQNAQIRHLAAAVIWIAGAGMAHAAPWSFEVTDIGEIRYHDAFQADTHGEFYLVVQCIEPGKLNLYVESPFDWSQSGNYIGNVPTAFLVDDRPITNVTFSYDSRSWGEAVVAWADGQQKAFLALVDALASARGLISIGYADRQAAFDSEGSRAAISQVRDACG